MRRTLQAFSAAHIAVLAVAGCSGPEHAPAATKAVDKGVAAEPIKTSSIDQGSVCKAALKDSQQTSLGILTAEPMSDKDAVSCYFLMTPEDSKNSAGYVVTLFKNEEALLQEADGTDTLPTKAMPRTVEGRLAAQQVMYGDTWRSSLTVDIGSGQFLFVERYSPGHTVAEKDLISQVRKATEQVLGNLEHRSKQGA